MYRSAYNSLKEWKMSADRKPMILLGARQVGKTWLMTEFGRNEYRNVVYINCDTEPMMRKLFLADYDINRLLLGFQAITGESIDEGETLIILDEIQEAPRGLHSLKYFCESAPGYHIMAAGSLLGITLTQQESFPVGKVDMLRIYPLTYIEFLRAMGHSALADMLESGDFTLIEPFSERLTQLLYEYYYVGGMPEVVKSFAEKKDLNRVRYLQNLILDAYRDDISKHTSKVESVRIGQVLESLPAQLAKENKKFIYGAIKPGARASAFELAIRWLIDAGLIFRVNRVNQLAVPVKIYEDVSAFKLFLLDVGLLGCMADVPASMVMGFDGLSPEFRGMIAEEYVAQQLASRGYKIYYWSNDNSTSELDFIVQKDSMLLPIEVKSSTNVRAKSLSAYLKADPSRRGIRYSLMPYRGQEQMTNYPLFAAGIGL
ncbi:MAG: AAA family ATPase [Bacteroides sp.]|nr:AAA family ATPase [Bacteroides sp.]